MELKKILDLNRGSIISIVGAGGKSTLMYTLAEELRRNNKTLVTTTTKIYVPNEEQFDFIAIGLEDFKRLRCSDTNGVYLYGGFINEDNKLVGVNPEDLKNQFSYFDYILIESDGSKMKPIKGWNENEPVICENTTKTIGLLSIESIGKEINESNVHRIKKFTSITNSIEKDIISKENFISLIFHKEGLYKNSVGEKVLFINKVESKIERNLAQQLLEDIKERNKKYLLIDKIVIGSLKNKSYEHFNLLGGD